MHDVFACLFVCGGIVLESRSCYLLSAVVNSVGSFLFQRRGCGSKCREFRSAIGAFYSASPFPWREGVGVGVGSFVRSILKCKTWTWRRPGALVSLSGLSTKVGDGGGWSLTAE